MSYDPSKYYDKKTTPEEVAGRIFIHDHPVIVDGYPLEPADGDYSWTKPSKQFTRLSAEVQARVLNELNKLGFPNLVENWQSLEDYFDNRDNIQSDHAFNPQYNNLLVRLSQDPELLSYAIRYFPRLRFIYDKWQRFLKDVQNAQVIDAAQAKDPKQTIEQYLELFSNGKSGKFVWAGDFIDTQSKVAQWLSEHERDETPPPLTLPYQIRIGGSRFFVPPINIQVNQSYRAGSMTGGAIRQQNSPKFNTGHTDTTISLTLYFPNQESIWGYPGLDEDIDFDRDSDEKIDRFISSLRGLIAQFKYSPILPIRNEYLNRTYDITAVALQSISIQTMPNYPFCLAVNLELLSFNHKVFLPMVKDFNQAIKWGRFRQYMGRAANKLNSYVNQGFLVEKENPDPKAPRDAKILDSTGSSQSSFSKLADLGIDSGNDNPNKFDIYYPSNTPVKVYAPDTYAWRQPGEDNQLEVSRDLWAQFLTTLGYNPLAHPESLYDYLDHFDQAASSGPHGGISEYDILTEYLKRQGLALTNMDEDKMNAYIRERVNQRRTQLGSGYTDRMEEADTKLVKELWFYYMFKGHLNSPLFKQYMDQENAKRQMRIAEWDVPMTKLSLDWSKVLVQGVSVSLGNNFARLQLQMQAEPTLQHIGGKDAVVSVNMIVLGEDDLIKLRRAFDHISGLARLEHAHGMLGFLGIKNVITTLCGVKYVVPLNFSIDTIPNQPHAYNVRLDMVDFDIFQQKREMLSNEQQKEFIEMFGKRNPFLRVKQLWSSFNAYPDFPLGVYEEVDIFHFRGKKRRLIGHLDPDFYFKSFQTFDDDLVQQNLRNRPSKTWENTAYDPNTKNIEDPVHNADSFNEPQASQGRKKPIQPSAVDQQLADQNNNPDGTPYTGIDPNLADQAYGAQNIQMNVHFPPFGDGKPQMSGIAIKQGDAALANVDMSTGKFDIVSPDPTKPAAGFGSVREDHAGQSLNKALADGVTTPFGGDKGYGQPTAQKPGESLGRNDPMYQVQQMIEDVQYRSRSGRMVRAFPTYMLWLIDEGGNFAGTKLFDNFYGLQSVIDFSVHSSEDVLGDVMTLRLSNMYSKLDTPSSRMVRVNEDGTSLDLNPNNPSLAEILNDPNTIDQQLDKQIITKLDQGADNILSGTQNNYIRDLAGIRLKPGVRVHLRAGYSANPNSLQTIFNGTITQVTQGDIVEVVAQGDGIELSPYINTTDKDGDSGGIDGGINTGLWLSEPRDLMVRLLSMGSSTFRETFANAHNGKIFSENKFGIRHFGQILYEEMTSGEGERVLYVTEAIKAAKPDTGSDDPFAPGASKSGGWDNLVGNDSSTRTGVAAIMTQLWANSFRHRDYEIFKRNIYPGNGTGIAQYLGGDFPEAGIMIAEAAGADGGQAPIFKSPEVKRKADIERAKRGQTGTQDTQKDEQKKEDQTQDSGPSLGGFVEANVNGVTFGTYGLAKSGWDLFNKVMDGDLDDNPLLNALGITNHHDDDLKGFDEVSFRAQTYMKSVWDLFQVCAALLPNYVVAVRPFEDRSTVFYGKPHWLYTSGVIPVTTGIAKDDKSVKPIAPDEEQRRLLEKMRNMANPLADFEAQQKLFQSLNEVTAVNPAKTNVGMPYTGADVEGLPQFLDGSGKPITEESNSKVKLPFRQGPTVMEMHLPTDPDLQADVSKHLQSSNLPDKHKHPRYMDRVGGLRGGDPGFDPDAQDPNLPGQNGAFMYFNQPGFGPEEEQWYFNMRWPYVESTEQGNPKIPGHNQEDYRGKRVAIKSRKTGKIVIAAIGDYGPGGDLKIVAGMSPDCWYALGLDGVGTGTDDSVCFFGFVPQNTKLGPTDGSSSSGTSGTASASENPDSKSGSGGEVNTANVILSTATKAYANVLAPGADPKAFSSYTRGYLSSNINVWSVVEHYEDEKKDPIESVKRAADIDPVGHYARLLYDREYAQRIHTLVKKGVLGKEALLGSTELDFGSAFTDLGQLDQKQDPNDPTAKDDVKPGDVVQLAEMIWDQFRQSWGIGSKGDKYGVIAEIKESPWKTRRDYLFDADPETKKEFAPAEGDDKYDPLVDNAGRYTLEEEAYWQAASKNPPGARVSIWADGSIDEYDPDRADDKYDYLPTLLVGTFKKFLWQHPYARAWLVVTTDFNTSILPTDSMLATGVEFITGNWFGQGLAKAGATAVLGPVAFIIPPGKIEELTDAVNANELCDFGNSRVRLAWKEFLRITARDAFHGSDPLSNTEVKGPITDWTKKWDRGPNGELSDSATELLKWLQDYSDPGKKSQNPLARRLEDLSNSYNNTIGRLLSVSANSLQGLIALFRGQIQQLGYGLDMVGNMQRQARVLNRVLNDSIYYAEGSYLPDGRPDLLKMVDNPFTREYGEPVIEIREPFQRLHYIDSFQHILGNGIQENLNGVSTVVTASSDGKYPVTVYFDKGIQSNLQNEKAVETGIYWDNANGEGFFSFLHPLMNPIETLRGYSKAAQGSSDELLSKRIALWHLKESLKDIYQGEIFVLGDPDIRAHDLVYIADVYERMYGLVEVEAVTHHFTPEEGFITAITPNALVTINDPARWTFTKWITALFGAKNIRDDTRHHMGVFADDTSILRTRDWITTADLAQMLSVPMIGHTVYDGGANAIVKDFVAAKATGLYQTEADRMKLLEEVKSQGEAADQQKGGLPLGPQGGNPNNTDLLALQAGNIPGIGLLKDLGWDIWSWVKDNLLDQHGCYIQYLTKDGQPMDAGLSYAQGVAVGRFHTIELLPNILGIRVDTDGRITVNELLSNLGWNEVDTALAYKQTSWWVAQTQGHILDIAGLSPDGPMLDEQYIVSLMRVTKVEDGDTLNGIVVGGDLAANGANVELSFRLSGVRAPELANHQNPEYVPEDDIGLRAKEYLESIIPVGTVVVVRQLKSRPQEHWGRELAVVFHNAPDAPDVSREEVLMAQAGRIPDGNGGWKPSPVPAAAWDGYLDNGLPYTANWQMIMAGYADVDTTKLTLNDLDRGAILGPK